MGEIKTYELLDILDFNNVRKRMSVIVRQNGLIKLYCKGADSVIFERMDPSCEMIKETTVEHLNKFASEGLRTLCLANKIIDENFYQSWKYRLNEASCSLENREDKVDACYEEIEKNLILLGATAIEDKLQDGVPQTIANLASAGIKLWVLTGDKQETAINIGYSCQLLSDDMADVFVVEGFEFDQVKGELMACRDIMKTVAKQHKNSNMNCDVSVITFEDDTTNIHPSTCNTTINNNNGKINAITTNTVTRLNPNPDSMNDSNDFALVINGHSLIHALDPALERLFLEVASTCKAVICCRVTPLQKAMVVDLVKRYKKAVTLAIGDGANDVSMIKSMYFEI